MELRQQVPGALDRSSHELGEKTNESGKAKKIPLAIDVAEIKINRVTQRLEGEEGNTDRKQVFEAERHQGRRIGQTH